MTKIKNFAKEHFYIFALVALSILFFHNLLSSNKIMSNVHYVNDVSFYSFNMKESLFNHHSLPLWTPYYYSGRPLFAQPEYYFINLNLLFILLTGNIYLAMNLTVIIHLFIAGLGMYLLVNFFSENNNHGKKAAFISAFIYMFNGYIHSFVVPGNIMIMEGYSLVPFTLLFTIKALRNSNLVLNSIIAGLFIALQIFVGGVIYLPYIFVIILAYALVYLVHKNILKRTLKLVIVGILIAGVAFGISAVKLLPGLEFIKLSNRGAGIPYEEYLGQPIKLKDFAFTFITNNLLNGSNISSAIGIAGFVLLLFGLYRFMERTVVFSIIIIILSLLMSTDSFLTKFFFNVPVFNQIRHVERSIFLFSFASSILAGFGFLNLQSFTEKIFTEKFKKISKNAIFLLIFFILFFELFLLQTVPQSIDVIKPNEIPILDYMGKDASRFRTINLALSTLIGASGYNYYSQFGISEMKGGSGIWFNDYLNYLLIAQNEPAKFWGILNNKYAVMSSNTSIDGFNYIGRFRDCKSCTIWESFGPYLYENTKYLPRYYVVPNGILLAGDNALVKQFMYGLMLRNLNPSNTVLIEGTTINDYDAEFLSRFKMILLVKESISQETIAKLKKYVEQGGRIVPDFFNGQDSISNFGLDEIFNQTKGNYTEAKVDEYSHNKVVLNLNGEKGWLVASERFAYFSGWTASIDGNNIKIFKADNIISSVYLDGTKGKLIFEYEPSSYKIGKLISIVSFIVIVVYLLIIFIQKLRRRAAIFKSQGSQGGSNQN